MTHQHTCLMLQGTGSDVGKSILVAALCRALVNRGHHVAPFKPQNMALNSAVTSSGKEIGRAQAVQALACKIEATEHMNPVLLKPNSDIGAQIIIQGIALDSMDAADYHAYKKTAQNAVLESYAVLQKQFDHIIVEGAGSPAEINLRENDIANMGFAEAVDCPVILIADIDKGGVFAQIVGTLELLSASEQQRIIGIIINKFRGDIALLQDGLDWLEEKTGKPVLGVIPYIHNLHIEAEDSINNSQRQDGADLLNIIVPVLSRISNHTDFDALRLHPGVNLTYVHVDSPPPACDLIILPGTKNTIRDLEILQKNNWSAHINKHLRYGGKLIGICGGMQMLGNSITDPQHIESKTEKVNALGLLEFSTEITPHKTLQQKTGKLLMSDCAVTGYEIHMGISNGPAFGNPLINFGDHTDGFINADNNIIGSYLHGLFDAPDACNALLKWAGLNSEAEFDYQAVCEHQIQRLADVFAENVNIDNVITLAQQYHSENQT